MVQNLQLEALRDRDRRTQELLLRRFRSDDPQEIERLNVDVYSLNKGVALGYSAKFTNSEFGDDYRSEALAALWQAVEHYAPLQGTPFHHFARKLYIRKAVLKAVHANEFDGWPYKLFARRSDVLKAEEQLRVLGDDVTEEDIAEAAGCTVEVVQQIRHYEQASLVSIDSGTGQLAAAAFRPEDEVVDKILSQDAKEALKVLDHLEGFVFIRYHGIDGEPGESFVDIARALGRISRESVREIEVRARKKVLRELGRSRLAEG